MKNEAILKIRKKGIIKGMSSSYMDLTILLLFHPDMSSLVHCPICNQRRYAYISSVTEIKINEIRPRNFIFKVEKNKVLENIEFRVEQILNGLTSCFLSRSLDELHEGYLENMFVGEYVLNKLIF